VLGNWLEVIAVNSGVFLTLITASPIAREIAVSSPVNLETEVTSITIVLNEAERRT
jgi:hypothetical protein